MNFSSKIYFFNSKTGQKEEWIPLNPKEVKIYSCGPTVYNYPHIGNIRSFLFVDILRRFLKLMGYPLNQTMNITDVDDKIIRESIAKRISIEEFTKPWTEVFFADLDSIKIQKVENYPRATESIPEMLEILDRLKKNGLLYEKEDSYYFSVVKFPKYGTLSHVDFSGLKTGVRYDTDEYEKGDIRDFVLWKAKKEPLEKSWKTDHFGEGRPGWHLECSAMIRKIYNSGIDIHTGGIDLLFPHHENEIAQSEGAFPDETFVQLWMHCEHLLVDGEKMSKSKNNFYTLRDLLDKGFHANQIRFFFLNTHYRSKLNFSFEKLKDMDSSLSKIQEGWFRLAETYPEYADSQMELNGETAAFLLNFPDFREFLNALCDDLNLPKALSYFYEFLKNLNTGLDKSSLVPMEIQKSFLFFKVFQSIFDCLDLQRKQLSLDDEVKTKLESLILERKEAKKTRNFQRADAIREEVKQMGFILIDTKEGETQWKKDPKI